MKRLICADLPSKGRPAILEEDEAQHATRVLRLRNGESVLAIDGKGREIAAKLILQGKRTLLEFLEESRCESPSTLPRLVLEMAILKGDAMSWVIEKAVELGVDRLVPVFAERTVVQAKAKGDEAFLGRWKKIADQSLKQCGRLYAMEIDAPIQLDQLAHGVKRFWFDENLAGTRFSWTQHFTECFTEASEPLPEIRLLIGPEGGWSEKERQWLSSFGEASSLGPLILRAETASVFAVSVARSRLIEARSAS